MPDLTGREPDGGRVTGGDERSERAPGGTPRWVKVFEIVALVLVVLVVILLLVGGGNHGPGRHTGDVAPPAGMTEAHRAPARGHG
jgi:hypothetical protein